MITTLNWITLAAAAIGAFALLVFFVGPRE